MQLSGCSEMPNNHSTLIENIQSINKRYIYEEDIYDISVNELCSLGMSGSKKEAHSQNNQGLDHC
jgi:hypothetical protein